MLFSICIERQNILCFAFMENTKGAYANYVYPFGTIIQQSLNLILLHYGCLQLVKEGCETILETHKQIMWRIDDMIGAQREIKLVKIILVKLYLVKSNNCFKFTCAFC